MSFALELKSVCGVCGNKYDLYGSKCKLMTVCYLCGQEMAKNCVKCNDCGTPTSHLIREYLVQDGKKSKTYYLARFPTGMPKFSNKKTAENEWCLHKEGVQKHQVTSDIWEKYKNKPWILEDETGEHQYQGQIGGAQEYYAMWMEQDGEFVAYPAVSGYTFNKIPQYKQLTLEEAEEKMNNRKRFASSSEERWMTNTADKDSTAVGDGERSQSPQKGAGKIGFLVRGGEKDQKEEPSRKHRLWVHKRIGDDDEEGLRGGDLDLDDDDFDKGDDWEHDEIFTDDDEAVGHEAVERDEIAPDVPVPPEIRQDEDDDEGEEEGTKLTNSGKELKKLLGQDAGDSDDDDDDEFDNLSDDEDYHELKGTVKEELVDQGTSKGAPTTSRKTKRKAEEDDNKGQNGSKVKKIKTDNALPKSVKSNIKAEEVDTEGNSASTAKKIMMKNVPLKSNMSKRKEEDDIERGGGTTSKKIKIDSNNIQPAKMSSSKAKATPAAKPVTEEEMRAAFEHKASITAAELVRGFQRKIEVQGEQTSFQRTLATNMQSKEVGWK